MAAALASKGMAAAFGVMPQQQPVVGQQQFAQPSAYGIGGQQAPSYPRPPSPLDAEAALGFSGLAIAAPHLACAVQHAQQMVATKSAEQQAAAALYQYAAAEAATDASQLAAAAAKAQHADAAYSAAAAQLQRAALAAGPARQQLPVASGLGADIFTPQVSPVAAGISTPQVPLRSYSATWPSKASSSQFQAPSSSVAIPSPSSIFDTHSIAGACAADALPAATIERWMAASAAEALGRPAIPETNAAHAAYAGAALDLTLPIKGSTPGYVKILCTSGGVFRRLPGGSYEYEGAPTTTGNQNSSLFEDHFALFSYVFLCICMYPLSSYAFVAFTPQFEMADLREER
jgi:hypothetical protein